MSDEERTPANRRGFVVAMASAVAVAAAAITPPAPKGGTAKASGTSEADGKEGRKVQYGMLIDVRRCIGCHACTVACKSEFDVPLGVNRSWVEYVEKGVYPNVGRSFLPRLCNHCSEPPCVSVCPTDATWKRDEDGIVVIDSGLCIGCKYCIQACPYDARFPNPVTKVAAQCDFCIHRVSTGPHARARTRHARSASTSGRSGLSGPPGNPASAGRAWSRRVTTWHL